MGRQLPLRYLKPFVFGCVGLVCLYQVYISSKASHAVRGADFSDIFLDDSMANKVQNIENLLRSRTSEENKLCILPHSIDHLLGQMENDVHWNWIAERVARNWDPVYTATQKLHAEGKLANRTCLYVLVLPGVLTQTNFAQRAFEGGPLGELLQWADLVTALHALGHKLTLRYDLQYAALDLRRMLGEYPGSGVDGCSDGPYDVIFTDLGGHSSLPPEVLDSYRWRFRVVDTFGTEVAYNNKEYAQTHQLDRSAGMRDLFIKHFYTMYPETVDNSFLGFMVHPPKSIVPKEEKAILYGKDPLYIQRKKDFIGSLGKFVELHATLQSPQILEELPGIINHGVLRSEEYQGIAEKIKYFIGLGDPVEGPGMMEALSRGCIILQPLFEQPLTLHSLGKPSNRTMQTSCPLNITYELLSQVPYVLRISPPNVFTFKYSDPFQLAEVFKTTASAEVVSKLPYEFTAEGYVERLQLTLTKHDLCVKPWKRKPRETAVKPVMSSEADWSCARVCNEKGLLCDVTEFEHINSLASLQKLSNCSTTRSEKDVFAPAIQRNECILQGDTKLFSCASYTGSQIYRMCPCVPCDRTNQYFCGSR